MADKKTPTEIEEIRKAYKNRIKRKDLFDATVDLSVEQPEHSMVSIPLASQKSGSQTYRLLDEGYIMDTAGNPYLYVAKGVSKKIYNSLDTKFLGRINLGHTRYAEFPFDLGTYTKKDLQVVGMGGGRMALDVSPHWDEESLFIKELRRTGAEVGLSIEMDAIMDWTEEGYGKTGVPTIVDAKSYAFAVVGDAGNARSGGITLNAKGDIMGKFDNFLTKFGLKAEEAAPDTEPAEVKEDITLSAEDYQKMTEAVELATRVMEENEQAEQLLAVMDARIDELTEELAELKAKESEIDTLKEELSTKEENVTNVLTQFTALTAKYQERANKVAEDGAVELKAKAKAKNKKVEPFEEMSESGFGKEL